ncbi:hypothetical protein [Streptomyces griseorubiginosus]|uniref:hypothetical protein n=1 Tax=Streptomyces griseorubiginosus TaxID=67304 RepID=UPI0036EC416B
MRAGSGRRRPWIASPRLVLALFTIALAHFATALAFGHSVTGALRSLAEDAVLFAVLLSVIAYVRSRTR